MFFDKGYLANKHLSSTLKEKKPSSPLVNTIDWNHSCKNIDTASDHSWHERSIASKPNCVEQNRGVEHDHIDPGQLLEEGDEDGHAEVRPVLPLQQVPPWILNLLRRFTSSNKVTELLTDIVHAANALKFGLGFIVLAALNHGVGCVW